MLSSLGASPLEKSLASLKKSTVSFNEKTLRWHDSQTKLMVKGNDARVQAAKLKPEPSAVQKAVKDEMVTKKKVGLGFISSQLKEIQESLAYSVNLLFGMHGALVGTAESKKEGKTASKNAAKEEEKQTGFLKGIWNTGKEKAKKSWFAENWKMILAGLLFLFAPLKWIKKLWAFVKVAWDFTKKHPLVAAIIALTAYFFGGAFIKAIGSLVVGKAMSAGSKLLQARQATSMMSPAQKAASVSRAANAAKVGPRVGKAVPTKGIFGKIVEKFGKAGKWIKQLGSRFIMPLITTPAGWAILAGLAIGGLVYVFWDEIKAGVEKAFGFLTGAIDSLKKKLQSISIIGMIRSFISVLPKMLQGPLLSIFGEGKKDKPIKDTGEYAEGPTPDDIKTKVAEKGLSKGAWVQQQAGGGGAKESAWRKSMGGNAGVKQAYKDYKAGFSGGTTPPTSTTPPASTPPVSTSRPVQPSSISAPPITTTPSGEEKHKAVKVSNAKMSGVSWNKLGGRDTIEDAILTTWNQADVSATPTFTSGFRNKDHALSKSNPQSQHIQRTAFDLRSSDLGAKAGAVWSDLKSKMAGMGLWGQWEKGSVNKGKRTGEHFHFQLAAKGFEGIVGKDGPRGFIAGEAGEELVRIQPLVSPDDKMNAMNTLNTKNQTLQSEKSGSPVIISNTTNASASTANSTSLIPLTTTVHAPKLTTSLPS